MSVLLFDDNDDNTEKFSLKKEGRSIKIDEEKIFQTLKIADLRGVLV